MVLNGTWTGHFTYGEGFPESLHDKSTEIRIEIEETDDEFTGTYTESGFAANSDIAPIEGFIENDFISITKRPPRFFGIKEDGTTMYDDTLEHPEVSYSGYFNEESNCFEGEWEKTFDVELPNGKKVTAMVTGTWMIKKIE